MVDPTARNVNRGERIEWKESVGTVPVGGRLIVEGIAKGRKREMFFVDAAAVGMEERLSRRRSQRVVDARGRDGIAQRWL